MKYLYRLTLIFVALAITSCGTMPGSTVVMAKREAAKLRPAYKQFQELCNAEDRVVIYETKKVDGYLFADAAYGANCEGDGWEPLFKEGYKFYECSAGKFSDYESILGDKIYHFYIAEANDSACIEESDFSNERISKYTSEYYRNINLVKKIKLYKEKLKSNQCLAKREVLYPESLYAKVLEFRYLDSEGNHILGESDKKIEKDLISFYGYSVIGIETGKVLAVINREYHYTPEPGDRTIGGFQCDEKENINFTNVLKVN